MFLLMKLPCSLFLDFQYWFCSDNHGPHLMESLLSLSCMSPEGLLRALLKYKQEHFFQTLVPFLSLTWHCVNDVTLRIHSWGLMYTTLLEFILKVCAHKRKILRTYYALELTLLQRNTTILLKKLVVFCCWFQQV